MSETNNFCKVIIASSLCFSENIDTIIDALPFGEAEKTRLSSINNPAYKQSSLSALLCLAELLSLTELSAKDKTILRERGGKPYFAELDLFFSISHAEDTVAVALSDSPVGIDVEFIDTKRDTASLSRRFFAPEEHKSISESTCPEDAFFALWTKKEALSKISGKGLSSICRADTLASDYDFSLFTINDGDKRAYLSVCREHCACAPMLNKDFLIKKRCDLYEIQN